MENQMDMSWKLLHVGVILGYCLGDFNAVRCRHFSDMGSLMTYTP